MAKKPKGPTIEEELLEATGEKPQGKKESNQDYYARLVEAVQDLKDADWDKLSDAAQEWVNDGATAIKKDKDIDDFPDAEAPASDEGDDDRGSDDTGDDDDAGEDADDDDKKEDDDVAKKSKKGGGKSKPDKAASKAKDDDKPAKSAKAKGGKEKKPGAQVMIKKLVIKDPEMSTEKIAAKLDAAGVSATPSAISTIRSGTLQTLRLVKELGLPKGDF